MLELLISDLTSEVFIFHPGQDHRITVANMLKSANPYFGGADVKMVFLVCEVVSVTDC
jgi:hypothetical protein